MSIPVDLQTDCEKVWGEVEEIASNVRNETDFSLILSIARREYLVLLFDRLGAIHERIETELKIQQQREVL